jgi:organic radical activating enzyme
MHVSLTGGEPLLQSGFIKELADSVDYPLYLETNSTLPGEAVKVASRIEVAACDIKLAEHNACEDYNTLLDSILKTIKIFHDNCSVFAKIIVLPQTTVDTLMPAVCGLAEIDREIPLVLQPLTPPVSTDKILRLRTLLQLTDAAGEYLNNVRVIPQIHRLLGAL